MGVKERVFSCRVIERMEHCPETCKRLGVENASVFRGRVVSAGIAGGSAKPNTQGGSEEIGWE